VKRAAFSRAESALAPSQRSDVNQAVFETAVVPTDYARAPLNQCSACGLDFGSLGAFDKHRIGIFAHQWSPEHTDGRRCLTTDELTRRGFRQDARGRWRQPSSGREPWGTR
jgi:hypothetical protein